MELPSSVSTRLQYQHKSVVDIIDGLTDAQIRRAPEPGKWSVFEILVHLQTYQHVFIARVREILGGNKPVFERYTAEADPLFLDQCGKTTREVMQDLLSTRKQLCSEILHFETADFHKTGSHPVFGEMSLLQWINFFLLHEAHHLFIIFKQAAVTRREG